MRDRCRICGNRHRLTKGGTLGSHRSTESADGRLCPGSGRKPKGQPEKKATATEPPSMPW